MFVSIGVVFLWSLVSSIFGDWRLGIRDWYDLQNRPKVHLELYRGWTPRWSRQMRMTLTVDGDSVSTHQISYDITRMHRLTPSLGSSCRLQRKCSLASTIPSKDGQSPQQSPINRSSRASPSQSPIQGQKETYQSRHPF